MQCTCRIICRVHATQRCACGAPAVYMVLCIWYCMHLRRWARQRRNQGAACPRASHPPSAGRRGTAPTWHIVLGGVSRRGAHGHGHGHAHAHAHAHAHTRAMHMHTRGMHMHMHTLAHAHAHAVCACGSRQKPSSGSSRACRHVLSSCPSRASSSHAAYSTGQVRDATWIVRNQRSLTTFYFLLLLITDYF